MDSLTTEAPVNPRILKASADLTTHLVSLGLEPGEQLVKAEVVVRNGVPRKWKVWHEPDWQEPERCI